MNISAAAELVTDGFPVLFFTRLFFFLLCCVTLDIITYLFRTVLQQLKDHCFEGGASNDVIL